MGLVQDLLRKRGIGGLKKPSAQTEENVSFKFSDGTTIVRIDDQRRFFHEAVESGTPLVSSRRAHEFTHFSLRRGERSVAMIEVDSMSRLATLMDSPRLGGISDDDIDKIGEFAASQGLRLDLPHAKPAPKAAMEPRF